MNHRFLLLAVVASLALAGCADDADPPATTTTPTGGTTTPTGATTTTPTATTPATGGSDDLSAIWGEIPDEYGMSMVLEKEGKEVMTMRGAFQDAAETSFIRITMDPEALGEGGDAEQAQLLADGFFIYTSPQGAFYLVGDTQFVFPEDAENGFVPSPDESPFGEFLQPGEFVGDEDSNYTIKSEEATTWKGQAATRYVVETTDGEGTVTEATLVVYDSPRRPAHVEAVMPVETDEETGQPDPFSGGTMKMDILYDDEIAVEIPEGVDRALGLAYTSDAMQRMYAGGSQDGVYEETWNFSGDAGISLDEIEVQVKDDAEGEAQSNPSAISQLPTLWSMTLSEGTKTQDGVTLTYDDADGDGAVSPGDTLTVRSESGERPTAVLYDTVAQKYVVPGAGLWALLGALGLLAVALRRRA